MTICKVTYRILPTIKLPDCNQILIKIFVNISMCFLDYDWWIVEIACTQQGSDQRTGKKCFPYKTLQQKDQRKHGLHTK